MGRRSSQSYTAIQKQQNGNESKNELWSIDYRSTNPTNTPNVYSKSVQSTQPKLCLFQVRHQRGIDSIPIMYGKDSRHCQSQFYHSSQNNHQKKEETIMKYQTANTSSNHQKK